MKKLILLALPAVILAAMLTTFSVHAAENTIPATNASVTFLYYKNLGDAARFYGDILGFKKVFDGGWVKIYQIANGGRVGLVDEKKGYLKTADDKPVMLSIDTSEVKKWYERIKLKGPEYLKTHLKPESEGFANSFLLTDPEGYYVEFFQWNKKHEK